MKYILFTFLSLTLITLGYSQDHFDLMDSGETNFEKIEEAFYRFYERTGRNDSDLKKFERWKYYMKPRLINGNIPGTQQKLQAIQEYDNRARNGQSLRPETTESWESLGPEQWVVNSYGYSPGNGRVNAITVDPNNPNKLFAGAAGGGVWISENGGTTWYTTTDNFPVLGITDIHVNPANSLEVIVLTGDGFGRDTPSIGLLKSVDGGQTWDILGLEQDPTLFVTYRRLQINPQDEDHMIVAGSSGIFLSNDGGTNWVNTLSENISDVVFHPTNPQKVYAAFHTESVTSQVTMYVSEDGGSTWDERIFDGFGSNYSIRLGRKVIGVSPAEPSKVYVLAVDVSNNALGGFFSSSTELDDLYLKAASPNILGWSKSGSDDRGQGWYDLAIAVDPTNADRIYTGGVHVWKSEDGGSDWDLQNYWIYDDPVFPYVHADVHTLDFYHGKLYAGCDGGLFVTDDNGLTFDNLSFGMNIGQFYRLSVHPTDPGIVAGGLQDNGSYYRGSSGWSQIYGADGMEVIIDFQNPEIIFSASQRGFIKRFSAEGAVISRYIDSPNENAAWVTPYIMHPTDNQILYFGYENLYKTTNQGNSLFKISNFESADPINVVKQHSQNPDHLLVRKANEIFLTVDEGANWERISDNLGGNIGDVSFSAEDPEIIYVTFTDWEGSNNVEVSFNSGVDWENYSEGLPDAPVNAILSRNDCDKTLFVGTDVGVFKRKKIESEWTPLGEGLPNVAVAELEIQTSTNTLFAATYGRGIWKIDIDDTEDQIMAVEPVPPKKWGDEEFEIIISTTLPNEITISSLNTDIVEINGTTATIKEIGETFIEVQQEGTCTIYLPITVDKADQIITFDNLPVYYDTQWDFPLEASSSAGLPITFITDKPKVLKIEGDLALIRGAGSAHITALQAGNEYYNSALAVRKPITVKADLLAEISIYPNPVLNNELTLSIPKNRGASKNIIIYDMRGQIMHQSDISINRNAAILDLTGLEKGMYIMDVGERKFRFLKQ